MDLGPQRINRKKTQRLCLVINHDAMLFATHPPTPWPILSVLVGVVKVESARANCHHASINNGKLARGDETHMDPTGKQTLCAQLDESRLGSNAAQSGHHSTFASGTFLVHLRQET